jgi:hypothetical protein
VDVTVTATPDNTAWTLTDLLGRDMGCVREVGAGIFKIQPEGRAVETMAALVSKSYASLDEALAAIEEHTRGVCRRAPEVTQGP